MRYIRQLKLALYSTTLAALLLAYLVCAIVFIENAKADTSEYSISEYGYWYDAFHSDSRTARAFSITTVSNAIAAYAYGRAVGSINPASSEELDYELTDALAEQTMGCFTGMTLEENTTLFFSWSKEVRIPMDLRLGAAITLYAETLCEMVSTGGTE